MTVEPGDPGAPRQAVVKTVGVCGVGGSPAGTSITAQQTGERATDGAGEGARGGVRNAVRREFFERHR